MNRQNNQQHEVIVSGIHLELTPSLKTFVREKSERLFRHEERIMRLRVELECDAKESVGTRFEASDEAPGDDGNRAKDGGDGRDAARTATRRRW